MHTGSSAPHFRQSLSSGCLVSHRLCGFCLFSHRLPPSEAPAPIRTEGVMRHACTDRMNSVTDPKLCVCEGATVCIFMGGLQVFMTLITGRVGMVTALMYSMSIAVLQDPLEDAETSLADGKDEEMAVVVAGGSPESMADGAPEGPRPPPSPVDAEQPLPILVAVSASDVPPPPAAGISDLPGAVTAALDALPLPPADVVNVIVGGSDSPPGAVALLDDDEPPMLTVQALTRVGE